MIKINISIIIICLFFLKCKKASPKSVFFIYENNISESKRLFKIEKRININGLENRFYHDHIDSTYLSVEIPRKILFEKNKTIFNYLLYQFPLNREKVGNCHTYEYYIEEDMPPFIYKLCLIRNIVDTVINDIVIKNASLYSLKSLDDRIDRTSLNIIFDWDRQIIIEEKGKGFHTKLIKIQ